MLKLSAAILLDLWERGLDLSPVERALALLNAAWPDEDFDALARLSIGERDRRLLALREQWFGPRMACTTACPECAAPLELDIVIEDLLGSSITEAAMPLRVQSGSHSIVFRLPSSSDLLALAPQDANTHSLIQRCVLEIEPGGSPFETLPTGALREIAAAMALADPLADIQFALACPQCDYSWQAPFDIVSFLWNELDGWALRLMRDVHTLARAYGWSEDAIVALSRRRRAFYLQLVNDE